MPDRRLGRPHPPGKHRPMKGASKGARRSGHARRTLDILGLLMFLGKKGKCEDHSSLHPLWEIFPPLEEPPRLTLLGEWQTSWQPKWADVHAMQNSRRQKMNSTPETAIPGACNQKESGGPECCSKSPRSGSQCGSAMDHGFEEVP